MTWRSGHRLAKASRVEKRSFKREFISRSYNTLIKLMFRTKFSDAQCGFKAISRRVSRELVPLDSGQGVVLRYGTADIG